MVEIEQLKVITSHSVKMFVENGGRLKFQAMEYDGASVWLVIGINKSDEELPVVLSRAGTPKILNTAAAVYSYHRRMCPDESYVIIPHHPRKFDQTDSGEGD